MMYGDSIDNEIYEHIFLNGFYIFTVYHDHNLSIIHTIVN